MTVSTLTRLAVLPLTAVLFAYLEMGGNLYALRLLERRTLWSVAGTLVFSVLYSIMAAYVSRRLHMHLALLMVNYGFGFSIVAMVLKLDWGKLPAASGQLMRSTPGLWGVLALAVLGFIFSGWLVASSPSMDRNDPTASVPTGKKIDMIK